MTDYDWQLKIRNAKWALEDALRARRMWTLVIILGMILIGALYFLGACYAPMWFVPAIMGTVVGVPFVGHNVSEEMPWYTVHEARRNVTRWQDEYAYAVLRGGIDSVG